MSSAVGDDGIRTVIVGASGRMGGQLLRLIGEFPVLRLHGAVESEHSQALGQDATARVGAKPSGIDITGSLPPLLERAHLVRGEGPVDPLRAPLLGHAEQQEGAHAEAEVALDLAQQRVRTLLVDAGKPRNRLGRGQTLGDEQGLHQLLELDMHLAREGPDVLILAQASQSQWGGGVESGTGSGIHDRQCAPASGRRVILCHVETRWP